MGVHLEALIAAVRTPWIIAAHRWSELMSPAEPASPLDLSKARATLRVLSFLHRVRPRLWRTTCLYRSVAVALALRDAGVVLRIGVQREADEFGAHAWIEDVFGNVVYGEREHFTPLV